MQRLMQKNVYGVKTYLDLWRYGGCGVQWLKEDISDLLAGNLYRWPPLDELPGEELVILASQILAEQE